ncbi:MAG: hypothetical protein H6738_21275 [Alphaproteobacteria bacterium]|nr:hypothetical protein [Alphaproteobacteria bacterium]MCB9699327.1 hypothetical protein [Alphaproteobacteria bacterium]
MIAWLLALGTARGDTLVLQVAPTPLAGSLATDTDRVWLGAVSTMAGQPRIGRRVRTVGGAHLVMPMTARVAILPEGAIRRHLPLEATARARAPLDLGVRRPASAAPVAAAVLSVRAELVRFDGEVRLQEGSLARWSERSAGRELGAWDTEVASFGPGMTVEQHELSLWLPDDASGPQSVRVVYTIAPY